MIIPNAEYAVVDIRKLKDYCLDPQHETGKDKARVFASALNLTSENAEALVGALLVAVRTKDAKIGRSDLFGQRFTVDFELKHGGKKAVVRSGWIVKIGTDFPQLATCFVL